MIVRWASLAALAAVLAGCSLFHRRPPPPPPQVQYTVGAPYQLGGVWYYPKDQTEYDATGLAAVESGPPHATADGERFDPAVLAGSHRTLQLPAVARIINLENGREVLVRLNDRGPGNPGRLVGLTRHAADLLGARDGTQVQVQLETGMTQALADQLGGGPKLDVAAAPVATVTTQSLAPPPGVGQSSRARTAAVRGFGASSAPALAPSVPLRLPDQVTQGPARPGAIYLRASEFSRMDYARRIAALLAGLNPDIQRVRDGRSERFLVRAGPFNSVADADAALDQARRAGVIDSHLVVE